VDRDQGYAQPEAPRPAAPPPARQPELIVSAGLQSEPKRERSIDALAAAVAPARRAGMLTVQGDPAHVLALLDKALTGTDAAAGAHLRQNRSAAAGGAVSIPITTDDPLVTDRLVALLAESSAVRSLGFAPSAETLAADPVQQRRLKELEQQRGEQAAVAEGGPGGAGGVFRALDEQRKAAEDRRDDVASGKPAVKAAPAGVVPTVRVDPSGKREIVSAKAESADHDGKFAGRAGVRPTEQAAKGRGVDKNNNALGGAPVVGRFKSAAPAEAVAASGPGERKADAGGGQAGLRRQVESDDKQVQLGLLLERLEKRVADAAVEADKNRDDAPAAPVHGARGRESIRTASDQIRRQLLLLHLSGVEVGQAKSETAKSAAAAPTDRAGNGVPDAAAGPEPPAAPKTAVDLQKGAPPSTKSEPVRAGKVTLVITIRPE
jgi:hypothetical protein